MAGLVPAIYVFDAEDALSGTSPGAWAGISRPGVVFRSFTLVRTFSLFRLAKLASMPFWKSSG
jgi:hypothetical protein